MPTKPSTIAILCLLLIAGAAASNAVMDTLSFRYTNSVFPQGDAAAWWNPARSWKNKWQEGDPQKGEAFPGSSTAFVGTTDAWHFFKSLTILFLLVALILPFTKLFPAHPLVWVGVLLALKLLSGLIFESLFVHILVN